MTITMQQLESGQFTYTDPAIDIDAPRLPPVHPGEILQHEFLLPMAISAYRLAGDIGVPTSRILAIIHGDRSLTADTALRLGIYFGTSPSFWMNLQSSYDLEVATQALGDTLKETIKRVISAPMALKAGLATARKKATIKTGIKGKFANAAGKLQE